MRFSHRGRGTFFARAKKVPKETRPPNGATAPVSPVCLGPAQFHAAPAARNCRRPPWRRPLRGAIPNTQEKRARHTGVLNIPNSHHNSNHNTTHLSPSSPVAPPKWVVAVDVTPP